MVSYLFHFRFTDAEQYSLRPLSPLLPPPSHRRRSSTGGELVACLDYRVRWGRFHRCEAPNDIRCRCVLNCHAARFIVVKRPMCCESTGRHICDSELSFLIGSTNASLKELTNSQYLCVDTSFCQIAMPMSLTPHQMKKCAQSMLRLLNLPALFIHGNLDIYFFDHLVSDFQHLQSSAHLDRK